MAKHQEYQFPKSRLATIDICEFGKRKHHVTGLIEVDVTNGREKIKEYNRNNSLKISFTSWIISVISFTISKHETAAAFLKGKNKLFVFPNINVSLIIEKDLNGQKVPIPLIIEKAQEIDIQTISQIINNAKNKTITREEIVLQKKANKLESLYYSLPAFLRRYYWRYLLRRPKLAYSKMGNVAITSLGMMGNCKGWFIPISIHPICFGLGSIVKKPTVIKEKIEIREILNMSILIDHDVIDGGPIARFINDLSNNIENGLNL